MRAGAANVQHLPRNHRSFRTETGLGAALIGSRRTAPARSSWPLVPVSTPARPFPPAGRGPRGDDPRRSTVSLESRRLPRNWGWAAGCRSQRSVSRPVLRRRDLSWEGSSPGRLQRGRRVPAEPALSSSPRTGREFLAFRANRQRATSAVTSSPPLLLPWERSTLPAGRQRSPLLVPWRKTKGKGTALPLLPPSESADERRSGCSLAALRRLEWKTVGSAGRVIARSG